MQRLFLCLKTALYQGFEYPPKPQNKNDVIAICIKIRKNPCYAGVFKGFSALFFAPLKIHLRRHKKDPNGSISFKIYLGFLQPEAEGSPAPDT